jgi:hypothetical protein
MNKVTTPASPTQVKQEAMVGKELEVLVVTTPASPTQVNQLGAGAEATPPGGTTSRRGLMSPSHRRRRYQDGSNAGLGGTCLADPAASRVAASQRRDRDQQDAPDDRHRETNTGARMPIDQE